MKNSKTIGILGLGRTARAMAAYLLNKGCKVILWGRNIEVVAELREKGITVSGCIEGHFFPWVEEELASVCKRSDYLFVMTTAAGHRVIAEGLRGKLVRNQKIVIFNGNWGTYEFYQVLKDELQEKKVVVGETGGMIFIADYDCDTCHIKSIKNIMSLATFPSGYGKELVEELNPILPQLISEENVVVTSINNSNPIIHVPLVLFNYTRIENGEDFGFYKEGATPSAIHYVEAIDKERGNAARAVGVRFQSCLDIINSFWTDKKENLYEAMTQNPTYISAKGPKTMKYRYIEEDLPYGIMPLIALGKAYGMEMKRMTAMVDVLCCLLQITERNDPFSISIEDINQLIHIYRY